MYTTKFHFCTFSRFFCLIKGYTIYDGDATLMKQFQEQQSAPIEEDYLKSVENITTIEVDTGYW